MDLKVFEGKKIFVTGASGLIGRALVKTLLLARDGAPIEVVAAVRNEQKARAAFSDVPDAHLSYHVCDVRDLQPVAMGVDYVIHCASATASKTFVEKPVDVIESAVRGTKNVLELARANNAQGVVYLSTMEVYGAPTTDDKITESAPTNINPTDVRASYPESKRLCECLCAAYCAQYGVPVNTVRLTQTFGEGVAYDDGRVFAEFARCVIEERDIILKTKGETRRNYLYIADAVSAILTVLAHGKRGEAYNAANEETYCSIYEMARLVSDKFGGGKTAVRICEQDVSKLGYAPTLKMNLCADKLKGLGWRAETDLETAYAALIEYMRAHRG